MNNTNNALSFEAIINNSQFIASIGELNRQLKGVSDTAVSQADRMDGAFSKLGKVAAGYFAFNELSQLPQKLIQVRGEFQQLETAFTTMLGSKAKADQLFAQVVQLAATTPFDLKSVANGAKQLLAYGVASQDITKTLTRLGDVASGLSIPLNDLTYLYGTTKTQGRLFAQDLNQFVGRGIPLIKLLAEQFGVAESEVKGLVEQGKVGFPEVEKAINKLTDSGGMFAGLMAENAKSLTGLYSNFQDSIEQMFNKIGQSQEGLLAGSIKLATLTVQNYEPILDILTVIIAIYGAYKAAVIATAAVQSLAATGGAVSAWFSLAGSIRSAADAQALFNLTTNANPYVLAATAIVALVTAVALFRDTATEAEKAQQRLNAEIEKAEKIDIERKIRVDELRNSIQDETLSQEERKKKLQELIALSPSHLKAIDMENIATRESTEAIEAYIVAQKERMTQQALFDEKEKTRARIAELKSGKADSQFSPSLVESLSLAYSQKYGDANLLKEGKIITRKNREQSIKELEEYEKTLVAKSREGIEARRAQRIASSNEEKSDAAKTVKYYKEQIKNLEEEKDNSTSAAGAAAIQKKIDALDAKRRAITGELTKDQKQAEKEAAKIGPYGSLSYWDYIAQKAQEVISKTPANSANASKIQAQYRIQIEAEKKAEEIRKSYAVKSFEDELNEKRGQYELYQRWVEAYGKDAADQQFSSLISQSKSYTNYLDSQIKRLETQRNQNEGYLSGSDAASLSNLINEKREVTGGKTAIESFKDRLDAARESSYDLTEELLKLQAIRQTLDTNDSSESGAAKRKALAERELALQKERSDMLRDFLINVSGSEERETAIRRRYAELRIALDAKTADKKAKTYISALKLINNAEKEEIDNNKNDAREKTKEFKSFMLVVEKQYDDLKKIDIQKAREDFKRLTEGLDKNSKLYKQYYENLLKIEEDYQRKRVEIITTIATAAAQIGEAFSALDGNIGKVGSVLAGVSAQVATVVNTLGSLKKNEDGKFDIRSITSIVSLITQAIGLIVAGAKKLREAENAYFGGYQEFQNKLLLDNNEQIANDFKKNPFYTDYEGMAKAGAKAYQDASINYQKSIDKLSDGRAIVGFKGGFFRKDKNVYGDLLDTYPELVDSAGNLNKELAKTLIDTNQVDEATKKLLQSSLDWADQMQKAKEEIEGVVTALTGDIGNQLKDAMIEGFKAGESAADAFHLKMGDIIADIASQLLYSKIMGPALDKFVQDATASLLPGGDGTIVDNLLQLDKDGAEAAKIWEAAMKEMDAWRVQQGLAPIGGSTKDTSAVAKQGSITGASEESISILNGQINAIRITQADGLMVCRESLFQLVAINKNTSELYSIRADISEIRRALSSDFLRAVGG